MQRLVTAAMLVFVVAALVSSPATAASPGSEVDPEVVTKQGEQITDQQHQIHQLTKEVEKNNTISTTILAPIAVLVGILALGGSLGIVFSFRD
ncbi:MAG TPA: hypothetical protein VFS54_11030 [Solirubrobacterales bacterium]|nr:hypothetical protein [Solirubrobacterales bacterium]